MCGNFQPEDPSAELYASGVPADVLRACLVESSARIYNAYTTDVKNAFLLAPIPQESRTRILLRPPRILVLMGIVEEGEMWFVDRALYGLRQSPKCGGRF